MVEEKSIKNNEEDKIWDEVANEDDPQYIWLYQDYFEGRDCEICKKRHKTILKSSEWEKKGEPGEIKCDCKKENCICELVPLKVFNYRLKNDVEYRCNYGDKERAWKKEMFLRNIYEKDEKARELEKEHPEEAFKLYMQTYYELRNGGFDSYEIYGSAYTASVFAEKAKKYEEGVKLTEDYLLIDKERGQYLRQRGREEFKNRRDRYEKKLGISRNDSVVEQPDVVIIKKNDAFSGELISILKNKLRSNNFVLSSDGEKILLFNSGRKQSNVSLYDLKNKKEIWQKAFAGHTKPDFYKDFILLAQQTGRVGNGKSKIGVLDLKNDDMEIIFEGNDKLSELAKINNDLLVGCRDRFLYCLNEVSGLKWKYFIEENESIIDPDQYEKPCPYHVATCHNRILISSFYFIYMLNGDGELQWKWSKRMMPEETKIPLRHKGENMGEITLSLRMGEFHHILKIVLSESGPIVALSVIGDIFVYYFSNEGRLLESIKFEPKTSSCGVNISDSGRSIVLFQTNSVYFYKDKKQIGIFKKNGQDNFKIAHTDDDNYVVIYFYKILMIFNNGKLYAEVKFRKEIKASRLERGKLFVIADKFYIFEIKSNTAVKLLNNS